MYSKILQLATVIMAATAIASAAPGAVIREESTSVEATGAAITAGLPAVSTTDVVATTDPSVTDYNIGIAWMGTYESGSSVYINVDTLPSSCMDIVPAYDNQFSSLYLTGGTQCNFYLSHGCSGSYVRVYTSSGGYVHVLPSGYDNAISSYRCNYY